MKNSTLSFRYLFSVLVLFFAFSLSVWGAVYEKVTTAPSDWSGQYLIVYEAGGVAFDGSLTKLDATKNIKSVSIINNKITVTTDNFYFTIVKADGGGYTVQSKSGYYIGLNSDKNGLTSSINIKYANTLSLTTAGDVDLVSTNKPYLRYNAASDQERFRYYKSSSYTGQKAIQLYRLVEDVEEEKYKVTLYNAGVQYGDILEGSVVNLPEEGPTLSMDCQLVGWEFVGWSETEITADVSEVELVDNAYVPTQDCSLYAVYRKVTSSNTVDYTFILKSATEATSSPELPVGASISFNNTYTTDKAQMTANEAQRWKIIGLNAPLVAVSASMKTNTNDGDGKLEIKVGDDIVYNLSSYKSVYGHSAQYSSKQFELTSTDKVGDIVVTITASENSLYCQSLTITVGSVEFAYNSNPDCTEFEESVIMFGDVAAVETEYGKIANIPELPESCNPEYSQKVGWTTSTDVGVVDRPLIVDENTFFTQNTTLYPVYAKETGNDVWRIVTNQANLAAGDEIVIAAKEYDYAISTTQNNNNRGQAEITRDGDCITFGDDVQVIALEAGIEENTFAFDVGGMYLYAASSSSNYLRTEKILTGNSSWKITIVDSVASIVAQGANTRNVMRYNPSSKLFSCYSSGQKDLVIYKKTATEYYICGDVEVEADEVYAVRRDLSVNRLTIKSDKDKAGAVDVAVGTLNANCVVVEKVIDASRWYFFSLPFDCELSNVEATDNAGNSLTYAPDATSGDYVINEYNHVRSAATGKAWKELLGTNHTLNANQGYIVGHFGEGDVTIKFKSSEPQTIAIPTDKMLDYTDNWIVEGENSVRGFNLIGLPYYNKVSGGLNPQYVTIPNSDGKTYTQELYAEADIAPFSSFFVQTEEAPVFTIDSDVAAAPRLADMMTDEKIEVVLSDESGACDKATIINRPTASVDYEIGSDLVKWIGYASRPQIYSIQGDDILAFNTLPIVDSTVVRLGVYAPAEGNYRFALDDKLVEGVHDWVLYDNVGGQATSLSKSDYSVYLEKGEYANRFELRAEKRVATGEAEISTGVNVWIEENRLTVEGLNVGSTLTIYDAVGRLLTKTVADSSVWSYDCFERGVFVLVVENASNSKSIKFVY